MKSKMFATTSILVICCDLSAQAPTTRIPSTWSELTCLSDNQKPLGLGQEGDLGSKDRLKVIRRGMSLVVSANFQQLEKSTGTTLAPDVYQVSSETLHGIASVRNDGSDSVTHTLTINSKGDKAIWTETGISWMPPFQPFGYLVSLDCKREK